jgi:cytochrome b561
MGYDRYTKLFHWLIAALIGVEYLLVWMIPDGVRGPNALASYHMSFGIVILALMLARLLWRLYTDVPAPLAGTPPWQVQTSLWTHRTLYALLVILPFSGWLWVSARGWHVTLFGLVPLPQLVSKQPALAGILGETHSAVGTIVLLIVGFHIAAALYHHFVVKDGLMQRIWP